MPTLEEIRRALASRQPEVAGMEGSRRAAVAMVLRSGRDAQEVLFIERAERVGDPWSGHMAFPGGRIEPDDPDSRRAAERETLEEVGLDLTAAERLGRLDDLQGSRHAGVPAMVVSAFVYHLPDAPALAPNHEVREAFWFPLRELLLPERHVASVPAAITSYRGAALPGILVGHPDRHVVWGLTYRFLEVFFSAVGRPLPDRWETLRAAGPHR